MTREEALNILHNASVYHPDYLDALNMAIEALEQESTTKNDLGVREFEEIVVEYPPEDLCTYPEYKGKPYFGIKYKENEKEIVGYGTYNPEVLSQYLKNYFISTTKDYLGDDAVSRQAINEYIDFILTHGMGKKKSFDFIKKFVANLPPATPQEPKPMVEIDLYSVIKQKYIEREVLDKLRAEIETKYGQCDICEYFEDYDYEENDISEYRPIGDIADILEIIDKYKAESEG